MVAGSLGQSVRVSQPRPPRSAVRLRRRPSRHCRVGPGQDPGVDAGRSSPRCPPARRRRGDGLPRGPTTSADVSKYLRRPPGCRSSGCMKAGNSAASLAWDADVDPENVPPLFPQARALAPGRACQGRPRQPIQKRLCRSAEADGNRTRRRRGAPSTGSEDRRSQSPRFPRRRPQSHSGWPGDVTSAPRTPKARP